MDNQELVVGIDLGTTYSEIYTYINRQLEVIAGPNQIRLTRSQVFVDPSSIQNDIKFASGPKSNALRRRYPGNEIYEPKRIIGRKMDDQYVIQDLHFYPFQIVEGDDGVPMYSVQSTKQEDGVLLSAIDVDAQILRTIASYRKNVKKAVITVPAYFRKEQIDATKEAGSKAGLEVLACIPEPVAAAIAYATNHNVRNQTVVVYDLGGGTFDCCVVRIENGQFKVLSSEGHSHVGGSDFDNAIVRYVRDRIKEANPKHDVFSRRNDLRRLKEVAEKAKIALSSETAYNIVYTTSDPTDPNDKYDYQSDLTRAEFNALIEKDVKRTIEYVSRALGQLALTIDNIDEVVLVGGSTRIPMVQDMLAQFFRKDRIDTTLVNSDEAVAQGAAIYADELMRGNDMLRDSDAVIRKNWDNKLTPFGDPIFEVPYNIVADYGMGTVRIFSQSQPFPANGYRRVNRSASVAFPTITKFRMNIFKEEDGNKECIGILEMDVNERSTTATDPRFINISFIYHNDGRLEVRATNTLDQSSEQINLICRGDVLDDQYERYLWRKRYELEQKWGEVMEKLCKLDNTEEVVAKRNRLLEITTWFEEIAYEERENVERVEAELNELGKM